MEQSVFSCIHMYSVVYSEQFVNILFNLKKHFFLGNKPPLPPFFRQSYSVLLKKKVLVHEPFSIGRNPNDTNF